MPEPLFIRFANKQSGVDDIIKSVISGCEDKKSVQIAQEALKKPPEIDLFRRDFINMLNDLTENGINQHFKNYVDSYMKPSLEEFVEGSKASRSGEKRWVIVKEADTPWVEAIVCYNMCIYIRMYGIDAVKCCPVCHKFFSYKGKYGKYCSDPCKETGKKK